MNVLGKSDNDLQQAVEIIKEGGIILWPSCGVYGLACHDENKDA